MKQVGSRQVQANSLASCLGMLIGFFSSFLISSFYYNTHTHKKEIPVLYIYCLITGLLQTLSLRVAMSKLTITNSLYAPGFQIYFAS